jgi:exocyst complex component 2
MDFIIILSSSLLPRGKLLQTDMEQTFPGMSGDFTSENFSATWYLIENHSGTGYVLPQ